MDTSVVHRTTLIETELLRFLSGCTHDFRGHDSDDDQPEKRPVSENRLKNLNHFSPVLIDKLKCKSIYIQMSSKYF